MGHKITSPTWWTFLFYSLVESICSIHLVLISLFQRIKVVNEIAKLTSRVLEKITAIIWWLLFFKAWFCLKNYFNRNERSMLSHQLCNLPGYTGISILYKDRIFGKKKRDQCFVQPMAFTFIINTQSTWKISIISF